MMTPSWCDANKEPSNCNAQGQDLLTWVTNVDCVSLVSILVQIMWDYFRQKTTTDQCFAQAPQWDGFQ